MGIYLKFHHDHSPIMVMSHDLAGNFENFHFQPNFASMIGKVTNFWENWLKNKKN